MKSSSSPAPINTKEVITSSGRDDGTTDTSPNTIQNNTDNSNLTSIDNTNTNTQLTDEQIAANQNNESLHTLFATAESFRTLPGAFRVEGPGSAGNSGATTSNNSPTRGAIEEEEEQSSDIGIQEPEIEAADEEVCHVPSAYLVEEGDDEEGTMEVAQAEKVKPYVQRKEGQLTIAIVGGLLACLAILLGIFLSRGDKNDETSELVELTDRPTPSPTFDPRPTLAIVRDRGVVNCGIEDVNREGGVNLGEYNIDQCRALAATIFKDTTKINLVTVGADDRYERLLNHEVDVLYAGDTFTLEKSIRELSTGGRLAFGYPYYTYTDAVVYLGLETYIKCANEQKRYDECKDLSICAVDTPEIRMLITSFFPASFITFGTFPEMESSLKNETGGCNVLVSDTYRIYGSSEGLQDDITSGKYVISDYYISRNLLSSVVRWDDSAWFDIVEGSRQSIYRAAQIGLGKDESKCPINSTTDDISFYNAPLCVGNNNEAFQAHLGNVVLSFGSEAYLPSIDAPNFGSLECDDCKDVLKDGRLKVINDRGMLNCAVYLDPIHNLTQSSLATLVNVKFCKIMAVAIFQGQPDAVNITYIDELDYSSFPREYDLVAGTSWEDRVGFNTSNLGERSESFPYFIHDKYLYNGTVYDGSGEGLSFALDIEDETLLQVASSVIFATVYAQRNGISRSTYFEMPQMHLLGDSLTFMLRDAIAYAGNYDDILNEALASSDNATGIGWNTVIPNYGIAPKEPVLYCDYVASCPPCDWIEIDGGYICIGVLS